MVEAVRAAALDPLPHGFCGRRGGVSQGIYESLNVGLGSRDDRGAVSENRRRALAAVMPGMRLVTLHQVHSDRALAVSAPWPDDARPHADAMVTDRPGIALGILTADCAPVLLADAQAGVIGAAHAGWKGALGGIVGAVIEAMEALGAERVRIAAAIGPAIGQPSYEVDQRFRARFLAEDGANERFFLPGREGRHWFDLESYAARRLAEAGVAHIEPLGLDTCADEARFFSYRRATLRGETDYGRQLSLIALPGRER
ncbi:MAG: peptidoglycan editing factor PgeF [Sphingomonadaceae bacterium]